MNRLTPLFIITVAIILGTVNNLPGFDCEEGISGAKRLYSMAQEQLEANPRAAEDFLHSALDKINDCEYSDDLKHELYSALGQLYYKSGDNIKALEYLEMAVESGMNIESPNSFPAVLLGNICAENYHADATFFPCALINYKKALEINNFASSALAQQTESKYKQLREQTIRMEERIWEMARANEAKMEWEGALKCYDALLLLGQSDNLSHKKSKAQFNIHLSEVDKAMSESKSQEAGKALEEARATKYYSDGYGKDEFDKRLQQLQNAFKK
jgi:hypothetical protein